MKKILVTGGVGYIGSHTIVDLIANGFEVISIDNLSRSNHSIIEGIEKITNQKIKNYQIDLCDEKSLHKIFISEKNIEAIIHFAAFKAVEESVLQPLLYYKNNLLSLINLLECCNTYNIENFIFSSSCTVYGNPDKIPVTEETPLLPAASPYGATKQISEQIIENYTKVKSFNSILLRYFNPVGAHTSNDIGELPIGKPQNLFPIMTQTAIGKIPKMTVFGTNYNTKDGSCVRDYIHVCDIANAHTLALKYLFEKRNEKNIEVFNLGTGTGYTVLEIIHTFQKITGIQLKYEIGEKRLGDVEAIYANNNLAISKLGWKIQYDLSDMIKTAWNWELSLKAN